MSLIAELRRRKVFRVAAVYAATAFVVLQGGDILLPNLGVPDWGMRFLVVLVLLGFPIALVMAWALEIRPDGSVQRTAEAPTSQEDRQEDTTALLGGKTLVVVGLCVAVGIGLSAGWFLKPGDRAAGAESVPVKGVQEASTSIAVLPFVNMSGNADNVYFSDGLTETLLHKLAQVPDLKVAARTSSFAFKDQNSDIRSIAETLGVAHVLEGSVQRAGDRVRITAQLIQADDGYHLWSEVFDRDLDDIFAVQDDIAGQVAAALRGSLLAETAVSDEGGTDNAEAYDWYLKGRAALYDRNADGLAEAVTAMRRAIALDPEFALAWAGLSEALSEQALFTGRQFEVFESDEVIETARTAVRLAPDAPRIRIRLGRALLEARGEVSGARSELARALELEPDNPQALAAMSEVLWNESRFDEALAYSERAMMLDPLDWMLKVETVNRYMAVGDLEKAEALGRSIVDHDSDYIPGLQALGNVYWRTGRHVESFRIYHRLLEINPRTAYIMERIAQSFEALGDLDAALRWLDRAKGISPETIERARASLFQLRGDVEQATEILERLVETTVETTMDDERLDILRRLWLETELAMLRRDWAVLHTTSTERLQAMDPWELEWTKSWVRFDIALAADRLGKVDERDRLIAANLEWLDLREANGSDNQYLWKERAKAYAILGDANASANALDEAFERGYRERLETIHDPAFAAVLNDPAIRAVLDRVEESNRVDLQRLKALERELGDFEGEP